MNEISLLNFTTINKSLTILHSVRSRTFFKNVVKKQLLLEYALMKNFYTFILEIASKYEIAIMINSTNLKVKITWKLYLKVYEKLLNVLEKY